MSNVRIQDDLYEAVNGEWIEKAKIPDDKPAAGGFYKLVDENEKLLLKEFQPMLEGKVEVPEDLREFIKIYKQAGDFETRDMLGIEPVQSILDKILALESFEDFSAGLVQWVNEGLVTPWSIDIGPDLKNTDKHTLWFSSPGLILPDTSYYSDEKKEERERLLGVFRKMNEQFLAIDGFTSEKASDLIDKALAFDEKIVPFANTSEENNQVEHYYTPSTLGEVAQKWSNIPLHAMLNELTGTQMKSDERVAISEKRWGEHFNKVVNKENFEEIKAWMYVSQLSAYSHILSEEMRQIGGQYSRALSGVKEARAQNKHAFDLASGQFSQAVGLHYGHKYFGNEAKADIQHMVENMIEVYKQRLSENEWLTQTTIEKAIVKLDNLGVFVGYPDKLDEIYQKLLVDENRSLAENVLELNKIRRKKRWGEYIEPVDREKWHMPAHQVNAYFNPTANHIVFPAAILQAPFYSLEQSKSENYGGIGAVIAHEISHAFDNNGAKYDERGNLNNWWTDEDFAAFDEKKQAMIEEFDGLETAVGKANGILTVSENIADVGGLKAALTAAKAEDEVDLAGFWKNWARIWRMKARPEYQALLLSIDPHSPAKLRANIQAQNFAEFHETFGTKEGDGMFRPESNRVQIW